LIDTILSHLRSNKYEQQAVLYLLRFSRAIQENSIGSSRAGSSRCGAQCTTWARGPSDHWFYDIIVFSQPCYDRGRARIYNKALNRELSTFANVWEEYR